MATFSECALAISVRAWPGLLDRAACRPPGIAEIEAWVRTTGSPLRVIAARDDQPYEDAVARGTIPTREGSWHDLFNVLAFVRFGRAKAALHRRVLSLRRARMQGEPAARGRRSREEDALTLVDECALLVGGSASALARLQRARETGELRAVDQIVRGEGLALACFGHALLEHAVFERAPIGAGLVPLVLPAPGDGPIDDRFDLALACAIESGAFDAPRLSPTVPWPDAIVDAWFHAA